MIRVLLILILVAAPGLSLAEKDPAATCPSRKLKAIGKAAAGWLSCQATASKAGTAIDDTCVLKVQVKLDEQLATMRGGCIVPEEAPVIARFLSSLATSTTQTLQAEGPPSSCVAGKVKRTGTAVAQLLKAYSNQTVDPDTAAFEKTAAKVEASLVKTFVKLEKSPDCRTTQDLLLIHGIVRTAASALARFRNEGETLVFNGYVLAQYPGTPSFSGNSAQSMTIRFVDGPLVTITSTDDGVMLTTSDSHSLAISDDQFHFDGSLVDLDTGLAAMEDAFKIPPARWSAFQQVLMSYGALTRLYVASDLLLLGKGAHSAAGPSTPRSSHGVTRATTPISLRRNCNLNHDAACTTQAYLQAVGLAIWEWSKCQLPKPNRDGFDCRAAFSTCEAGLLIISEGTLTPISPLICLASVKLCNDIKRDPGDSGCEATERAKNSVPGYKQMCLQDSICPSGWSCEKSPTLYAGDPWRFRCNPAHCPDGFVSCVQGGVCCNNTLQSCDPDLEICVDNPTSTCPTGTSQCGPPPGQCCMEATATCDLATQACVQKTSATCPPIDPPDVDAEVGCCFWLNIGGFSGGQHGVTEESCAAVGRLPHILKAQHVGYRQFITGPRTTGLCCSADSRCPCLERLPGLSE